MTIKCPHCRKLVQVRVEVEGIGAVPKAKASGVPRHTRYYWRHREKILAKEKAIREQAKVSTKR